MTDAINAKSEVLDVRELDAVTGGFIRLPLVAVKVLEIRSQAQERVVVSLVRLVVRTTRPKCFNRFCSN